MVFNEEDKVLDKSWHELKEYKPWTLLSTEFVD